MGLAESGAVKVMQPTQVAAALGRMQRPATSRLDRALAQEVAQREGAKAIVDGDVTPVGAGFIVTVRLRATDPPDELASYRETAASATDLVPTIDRATRKLRGKIGESLKAVRASMPLERATTPSLAALRKFTEGFRKNAIERDYPAAIPLLEEAVALDSNFALAYRQLAIVYNNAGLRPGRRDSVVARAYRLRDRLPDLERALVEATYFNSGERTDRAKAIAANERATAIDPTNPSALNDLGLEAATRRQYARAESLFKQGQATHPEINFFWSNVIPVLIGEGKLDEADRAADEYRRRFPRNTNGVLLGMPAWSARGRLDSVVAICQRAAAASVPPQVRATALACLATAEMTRGRLRERNRLVADARSVQATRGVVFNTADVAAFDSAYQDIWFRERSADGLKHLDALAARPDLSLDVINLYALAGHADKARALLARYDSIVAVDTSRGRRERDRRRRALGEIAMAERKYDVAIREFHAADTLYDGAPTPCEACLLPSLAHAYDLAGKPDDAIRFFERYLASTYAFRGRDVDPHFLAGTYKRLGELYEAKGDREKAAGYYSRFVELWKDADPELQPKVSEVRKRLASLTSVERR